MITKIIRNEETYLIDTSNCTFEVTMTETKDKQLSKLWISENDKQGETILCLSVQKTCLGIILALLPLYGIEVGKA
ncbi:MAG: hypothetical protein ACRDCE_06135 [Cetobacterium sp.]|uniref:hypothetical protein n=1 Tax=Cetobacterium sp. TaxID=2071632 RepID=UPI003EE6D735